MSTGQRAGATPAAREPRTAAGAPGPGREAATGCSLTATLGVVGRRASLVLLREAFAGAHRFEEFVRRAGFTEAVTAARLRELVTDGLLERRPYQEPGQRSRDEYYLTDKGADFYPAMLALTRWGDKWAQPSGRGPVRFTHADCGAPVDTEIRCTHGHQVSLGQIEATGRPSRDQQEIKL